MTEIVALEDFSLVAQGPTLSFRLLPGQSVAVVGRAASGKTRFVRALCGVERAAQGSVHVIGKPAAAGRDGFSNRSCPQSILRHALAGQKSSHSAEALTACGLWDLRKVRISDLSTSQLVACELLGCLGPEAKLLVVDGQLDRIDPWTLSSVTEDLRKRLIDGSALVAVTNRPDLLAQFDSVIVLDQFRVVFAGPVEELMKKAPLSEVEVESQVQPGVRSLVAPFTVGVQEKPDGVVFHAEDGQELAARLLLEGYGDIKFVVLRRPSPEQALMHLLDSPLKKLKIG